MLADFYLPIECTFVHCYKKQEFNVFYVFEMVAPMFSSQNIGLVSFFFCMRLLRDPSLESRLIALNFKLKVRLHFLCFMIGNTGYTSLYRQKKPVIYFVTRLATDCSWFHPLSHRPNIPNRLATDQRPTSDRLATDQRQFHATQLAQTDQRPTSDRLATD